MGAEHGLIKEIREKERLKELRDYVASIAVISFVAFLVFAAIDALFLAEVNTVVLLVQTGLALAGLVTGYLIRKSSETRFLESIGGILVLLGSMACYAGVFVSGAVSSPYITSINIITMAVITFIPWSTKFVAINLSSIYAPYFLLLAFNSQLVSAKLLIPQVMLMLVTATISLVIRNFSEKLRMSEVEARFYLYQELNEREVDIAEKQVEGLRLADLARQFSPQVVQGIQSGSLNLHKGVHRAEICTIFIDIVNSTERLLRLDKDNVNKVISMFMEDTIKTLLKYDITIDKFLGDGVLGFSNDPIRQDDYVERVVRAAIEIRERIANRQEEYLYYWLNHMQVRIGIAVGFANVGFYGSNDYFKSYTAIGRVVNLASRICNVAEVNQILLSQEAAEKLKQSEYHLKSMGRMVLKGFADDLIGVYVLEDQKALLKPGTGVQECPHGHGVLRLTKNDEGIYAFSCRSCGFVQKSKSSDTALKNETVSDKSQVA